MNYFFQEDALWEVPLGASNTLLLRLQGGGGGGTAATVSDSCGGGGGGCAVAGTASIAVGDILTITVGKGGVASSIGVEIAGQQGGLTSVTNGSFIFTANGGTGGNLTIPGMGGTGSVSGVLTSVIQEGQGAAGSAGGDSFFGAGSKPPILTSSTNQTSLPLSNIATLGGGGAGQIPFGVNGATQATSGGDGFVRLTYIQRVDI